MSALDQLRSFSQALYNFSQPHGPVPMDITYSNWEQAFWHVAELTKERRMALLIDEFTYLLDVEPGIVGTLQKAWDHWLKNSNLMLILSGSQMGSMQKKVLSYQAPLYGRATAQLNLPPLPFGVTREFFPGYSARERVQIYAIFGGVPAYWERMNPELTVLENVREQALNQIRESLPAFIQDNSWQELCREWLLRASANEEMPFSVQDAGGAWTRTISVDVAGINRDTSELVLGTCVWGDEPAGLSALQELVAHTAAIVPEKGQWSVSYLGFSAAGWTGDARSFISGITRSGAGGDNWRPVWSKLLDLEMLEDDLVRWSVQTE